ncbi:uncharacterized protein ISCGN_006896 [Ixodes scapularis]
MYGLPKIHKPGCPLRPIVYVIGSSTYSLSKYLVMILSPLTGNNEFSVRNSRDFVELIRAQTLLPHEAMVSFDVISLFTNVPNALAVDVARDRLLADQSLSTRTTLLVDDVIFLLRFCLNQCNFSFNGDIYHQVSGCPMGSPVSVTVSNLVMEYVEEKVMSGIDFPVKFYRRYVDDTFVIVNRENVTDFHRNLNSVHPSIQFTCEHETDSTLPFLYVRVHRTSESFFKMETSVYGKPCDRQNFLDYHSHHPTQHKSSVVRSLPSSFRNSPI